MIRLGVNLDHVATVRQARRAPEPDPVHAAVLAILGGADGITIHLREDRRHIQDRDLRLLRETVCHQRLNLELAAVPAIVELACSTRPDEATLVPERREELTTEGGLDVVAHHDTVERAIHKLRAADIHVSLFIDPDPRQIETAKIMGAQAVELQTATYSEARGEQAVETARMALEESTRFAVAQGLHVHMGHGLNYVNVRPICRMPGVEELNIGHSIVARAILVGMRQAVGDMKRVIAAATPGG